MRIATQVLSGLPRTLLSALAISVMLGACAPSPAPESGPALVTPPLQVPTETAPPPTELPTAAPTDTVIPQPEVGPEEPALSIEMVAGKWEMRFLGGGGGDTGVFTLAEDGTFSMDAVTGEHAGMNLGTGTYRFEGDALLLESDDCLIPGPTDQFFACTGRYQAFVAMADSTPARLHLVAIEDASVDREKSLDGKTFKPYLE